MKIFLALSFILAAMGCSQSQERFPPASDRCRTGPCVSSSEITPQGKPGSAAPTGAPDSGKSAADAGALFGDVALVNGPDLSLSGRALTEPLMIYGPGFNGEVKTQYEPGGEFRLMPDGAAPWWVRVEPTDRSPELLSVVQRVQRPGAVQLFIIERQSLSDVSEALVFNPTALDPERGHAIIRFTGRRGAALAGVSAVPSSGVLAYDIGETYTDSTNATAARGAVAIFNIAASAPPGVGATLEVSFGRLKTVVSFPAVRNALTSADFALDAP